MLDYHLMTALLKLSLKPDPDLRKTLLEQKLAAQEAERKAQAEAEAKAAADQAAAAAAEEEARRKEALAAAAKEADERRAAKAAAAAIVAAAASAQKAEELAADANARNVTPDRSGQRKREVSKAAGANEKRGQTGATEAMRSPSLSRQASASGGSIAEEVKGDGAGKFLIRTFVVCYVYLTRTVRILRRILQQVVIGRATTLLRAGRRLGVGSRSSPHPRFREKTRAMWAPTVLPSRDLSGNIRLQVPAPMLDRGVGR
jgi:hypothetical protein